MGLEVFDIIPQLQPFIREICAVQFDSGSSPHMVRVLPDACVELFFNFGETHLANFSGQYSNNFQRSILTSRMSAFMDIAQQPGSSCIAVCVKPGQAFRFFPVSMAELSDKVVELKDIWHSKNSLLEDELASAKDNRSRSCIVQNFLLSLLKEEKAANAISSALQQIHHHKGQLTVRQLSKAATISQRHLGRLFHQTIGLSPKECINMERFLHSLKVLKAGRTASLTDIGYRSGYYDQAHFIHEYKRYTGMTPTELLASKNVLY